MKDFKPPFLALCAVVLGIALEVALCNFCLSSSPSFPDGPQSLEEVIAIAKTAGLHWRGQRDENSELSLNCCVVISDHPLTRYGANHLTVGDPGRPCWVGVAAVYSGKKRWTANYDAEHAAFWGDMFVYGDPEIIRRLTGREVDSPCCEEQAR
jgi:hypothetical protein